MKRSMSERQRAAEIIAAAVRAWGLDRIYGGTPQLEPWGRKGKRWAVSYALARTVNGAAYVNRPGEIELVMEGALAANGTVDSPERAAAVLYAALCNYDRDAAERLMGGAPIWRAVPVDALTEALYQLEGRAPAPRAWLEELVQAEARRHAWTQVVTGSREELARYVNGKPLDREMIRRVSRQHNTQFAFQYAEPHGWQEWTGDINPLP